MNPFRVQHLSYSAITLKKRFWYIFVYFQCDTLSVHIPFYKKYGKSFMKKVRLHPDAYVQTAMQFAYYRVYKKFV